MDRPWRYMNMQEVQSFLMDRIDDGFCFPLNPKWVLCDQGWYEVFEKLVASEAAQTGLVAPAVIDPAKPAPERYHKRGLHDTAPSGNARVSG